MNHKLSDKYLINIIKILIYTSLPYCQTLEVGDNNVNSNELIAKNASNTSQMYTFANSNSFMRLETNESWNILKPREVIFEFRTDRPHGLLMYHTVYNPLLGFPVYELYVMLENGRLKVIHEFGIEQKFVYIGQGLNHDHFHSVKININPTNGSLSAYLDNNDKNHKNNGRSIVLTSLASYLDRNIQPPIIPSVLYFGGINTRKTISHQQYSVPRFIGCLGKIKFHFSTNITTNQFIRSRSHNYISIIESEGLESGCVNLCKKLDLCAHNSLCINHYTYKSCDCFGTKHEDWHCRSYNISILTLRGYSFVSYKIYNYKNKVHSDLNRISFHFKTGVRDGILFYARGEQPQHNYIAISLQNGSLRFEMDLGDGPISASIDNIILIDDKWHNITIKHHSKNINIIIDNIDVKQLQLSGTHHHLHVDPDIFIGGLPSARFKTHLKKLIFPFDINHKFIGCLKFVYFNRINILYDLNKGNKAAQYHSVFPPEFGCSQLDPTSITMSTKISHFIINIAPTSQLKISLEFKAEKKDPILASGKLTDNSNTEKYWFLSLSEDMANFTISSSNSSLSPLWSISSNLKHLLNYWQHIAIDLDSNGKVSIISNYKFKNEDTIKGLSINSFYGNVSFGASFSTNSSRLEGLRGCLRDISLNQIQIDPRIIYSKYIVIGKISLDNCQLVNPCNRENVCQHGGQCIPSFETGNTECNCTKTGYIGKTCHFSLFKRTCEELYLEGYHKTGTYQIDIDRNGPLPPAHVICSMSEEDGSIQTIVEHNIRHQVVVRERGREGNYYLNVTYREFTPEMLHSLIKHSKQCSQYIKYECNSAPLGLSSYTWMQSTEPGHQVTSIGSGISGRCKCSTAQNCVDRTKYCNCDSETLGWKHDDGVFTNIKDVGITRMFFLQTKNLAQDSEAHLILGNVSCIDSNTREYEITFQTKESYLEVSGWEGGDMAVSFRTTATKAVIFYQAPLHSHHGYFKAILSAENEITFEYSVNDKPTSVKLVSSRRLNTGDWQQIWVDSDIHHMRFAVNSNYQLIDFENDDELSAFEGPLYVGGAPKHLLSDAEVRTGFIGCLRGLVLNEKVVNLYKHLHRKATNIEKGCRPFCRPDLCKNGATCIELWGSYECKCANPIGHTGRQCENDINTNSMTFITPSSYFQKLAEGKEVLPILEKDIIISFRTHMSNALIFYANDYFNNFVQLHIENGTHVVFTFNTDNRVVRGAVKVGDILTSGNPIQIKVDRSQRSKSILTTNDVSIIIDHPIKFLNKYSQKPWRVGDELELVKPARPPVPIEAHSQLFLGGVDEIGATSQIQGIVGCLQGFVIGGKLFDLEAAAKEPSTVAIGQIKPGCNMLCDRMPCANGGVCTEDWKNNRTLCNCSMTSYGGNTCNKDVGARFNGYSLVRYAIKTNKEVELQQISIHLAFSTDKKPSDSGRTILLVTYAHTSSYIHLALMADGGILIEDNSDSILRSNIVISDELSFADANRHWLLYTRKGQNAQLIVDSEIYDIFEISKSADNQQNNEESLVLVGATNNVDNRFENFSNFVGCISNVLVELNDVKIEPLESAFGGRSDLDLVRVEGDIKQGLCSEFKIHVPIVTSNPDGSHLLEVENELWLSPPDPMLVPFRTKPLLSKSGKQINKTPIFIVCLAFLLIVFSSVGLYMWNLQKTYKIRQFQGDTPFFHSKRNSSTRSREVKFNMISNTIDDSEAAVKLLQHQEIPQNNGRESHPLKETRNFEDIHKSSHQKFKDEANENLLNNCIIDDNIDNDNSSQGRVRFADST